jgi:hypothetical protein
LHLYKEEIKNLNHIIMKKLLVIVAAFAVSHVSAQMPGFNFNLPVQASAAKKGMIDHMLGFDGDAYYLLMHNKDDYFIQKLDKDFKQVAQGELSLRDRKGAKCDNAELINGGIVAFFRVEDKSSGTEQLYASAVDVLSLQTKGEPQKLADFDWGKKNPQWFRYNFSPGKKYLAIWGMADGGKDELKYKLIVLDKDLKKTEYAVSESRPGKVIKHDAPFVDDNGQPFVLVRSNASTRDWEERDWELHTFTPGGENISHRQSGWSIAASLLTSGLQ